MTIFTIKVTFLDYLISVFFSLLDIRKRNKRSHDKSKNVNLKRKCKHVLALSKLSITLKHSGRHMALSRLASLSISSLRNLDIDSKLYRQILGIPMGTNCAPLVADLFLFCYERDFMLSLSDNNQTDVIEAFNSTSRYLDDLLNIDNPYIQQMVGQICPTELKLNKANSSDTEAPFLDLNLSITNGIVSSKIYDKRDEFNFEIVNFPFLDGDVPRSPSYGVYISQLIRFARVCSNVDAFNNRNLFLTAKLLNKVIDIIKFESIF